MDKYKSMKNAVSVELDYTDDISKVDNADNVSQNILF